MHQFTRHLLTGVAILPLTIGTLMAATAAQAQVGPVTHSAGTTFIFPLASDPLFNQKLFGQTQNATWTGLGPIPKNPLTPRRVYGGSDFSSYVDDGDAIFFESSNVTSGIGVITNSQSLVSFDFTNNTGSDVRFDSTIIPAGLGFYLANVNDDCKYSSCAQVTGPGANLAFLKPSNAAVEDEDVDGDLIIGLASFDFSINDGKSELYRVSGTLRLKYSDTDGVFVDPLDADSAFVDPEEFMPIGGKLKGFTRATPLGDLSAVAYAWDSTNVSFQLGEGLHKLSYSTSVSSWSLAKPLACGASLVAFSGFGDPVGRGGAVEDFALRSASSVDTFSSASSSGSGGCDGIGGIKGVNFTSSSYKPPVFDGKRLTYGNPSAAVPEPTTWALMIGGFGLAGAALRRRRLVTYN